MAYIFERREFFTCKVINICPIILVTLVWMLIRSTHLKMVGFNSQNWFQHEPLMQFRKFP